MPEETVVEAVRRTVTVAASLERAFATFTRGIGSWWPRSHHLVGGEGIEMVFEEQVGGRILERDAAGNECAWARILVYDPPRCVVFSWDITPQWQLERDPARASEVEVRFTAEATGRTRVDLEHRLLERHGGDWEALRDGVAGERGWPLILEQFSAALDRA